MDLMMRDDDSGGSPIVLKETENESDEESQNANADDFQQSIDFSEMLYRGPMQEDANLRPNSD